MVLKRRNFRRRNRRVRRGHRRFGKAKMSRIQSIIVRQPGTVVPDRTFCRLNFVDITNVAIGTVGSAFGGIQYGLNTFQPLGVQVYLGFTYMANLYRYYRFHGSKIIVNFCNMETFPVQVGVIPTNAALAISLFDNQKLVQNTFSAMKQLSPKGGLDRCTIKKYIGVKKIVGSKTAMYDETYAAFVTNNPSNVVYWNVVTYPTNNASVYTANNQIQIEVKMTGYIEFFERSTLVL